MHECARQLETIVGTPSPQKRQQNGLHLNLKTLNIGLLSCKRPYYAEHTGSRLIPEVKQHRASSLLEWETTWEHGVLLAQIFFCKN